MENTSKPKYAYLVNIQLFDDTDRLVKGKIVDVFIELNSYQNDSHMTKFQ